MRSRLNRIGDWDGLARQANYQVAALAEACSVDPRQLGRFFLSTLKMTPGEWLERLRQQDALLFLGTGALAKEAAGKAKYAHASSFSRAFKKIHGFSPNQLPPAPPPA